MINNIPAGERTSKLRNYSEVMSLSRFTNQDDESGSSLLAGSGKFFNEEYTAKDKESKHEGIEG